MLHASRKCGLGFSDTTTTLTGDDALKALSTLATIVAEFGDYSRQCCGQGLRQRSDG